MARFIVLPGTWFFLEAGMCTCAYLEIWSLVHVFGGRYVYMA